MNNSPQRVSPDFKPNQSVYELGAKTGMDTEFIDSLVPEFIIYWEESRGTKKSWNATFLNHMKHQWSRKMKQEKSTRGAHPQSNQEWVKPVIKIAKSRPTLKDLIKSVHGG